jgi:predicted GH43/DUF377 family glycosyl hydrolase
MLSALFCTLLTSGIAAADDTPPDRLEKWLTPQSWQRDVEGPVVELGTSGEFDDTHIFAPCVARIGDRFLLWYCGSRGTVKERVFNLGLTSSSGDGRHFVKSAANPVFEFGDGRHSVLTPTILRNLNGTPQREDGKLRIWFSSTHFAGGGPHTLHETSSTDGIRWSKPSAALLEHVYAPTILQDRDEYRMWYTDVSSDPWVFRHASSRDGRAWRVTPHPVLVIDQAWEQQRLFYPTVVKVDNVYLLWYGSYWSAQANKTALGFAASTDGLRWYKNPHNPIFKPEPKHPWESHYTTSQSIVRLTDGTWRIWYATRKAPPFVNKYFAIGTARWDGPGSK